MSRKRVWISACVLALIAAVAVPGIQLAGGGTERLTNGSFEEGFHATPAGAVGNGWHAFTHGGRTDSGLDVLEWATMGEALGAGEILLNSMDKVLCGPLIPFPIS